MLWCAVLRCAVLRCRLGRCFACRLPCLLPWHTHFPQPNWPTNSAGGRTTALKHGGMTTISAVLVPTLQSAPCSPQPTAGGRTTTRRRGSLRSTCPPTSSGCGRSSSSRWVPKVWANVCPCVISHRSAVGAAAGECPGAGVGPCLMRPRPAEGAAAGGRRHLRGRSACACFYSRLPVGCGALAIGACLGMPHRAPVTRPALAACSCAADHTPFSVLPPPAGRAWLV